MVSGFLTSPLDQERMASGEATEIATDSTWLTLSRPSNSRVDSLVVIIVQKRGHFSPELISELSQGRLGRGRLFERVRIAHFDVHAQGLHLLDEHIERFGHAGFER